MATNGQRAMLPLQLLLNPDAAGPITLPVDQVFAFPLTHRIPRISAPTYIMSKFSTSRVRKTRDPDTATRTGPRGPVNFPPFEILDDLSLQLVATFDVKPFGQIHQRFEHFPYNSEKRDLLEKTGRESIEAFTYEFRVPGSDSTYVVMWDYNIGIVRLASLFRLCGFNKTGPAQTFSKNPGLLEITPNITGGAVPAQGKASERTARCGYWFPYRCAKAICARFCHHIAGALIPVFGPQFPSECTPPDSPRYRRLNINPQIVMEAAQEASMSQRLYLNRDIRGTRGLTNHSVVGGLQFPGGNQQNSYTRISEILPHGDSYGSTHERSNKRPCLRRSPVDNSCRPPRHHAEIISSLDLPQIEGCTSRHIGQPLHDNIQKQTKQYQARDLAVEREKAQIQFEEVAEMAGSTIPDDAKDRTVEEEEEAHKCTGVEGKTPDVEQYDAALILLSIRAEDRRDSHCMDADPQKAQGTQKTHSQAS